MFLFNSRDIRYKNPFGAIAEHQTADIRFPVSHSVNARAVYMIIRGDTETRKITLIREWTENGYDIFKTSFSLDKRGIYYYRFEVETGGGILFIGAGRDGSAVRGDWLPEWQLTVFGSDYSTPECFKGGIIYHIFADRFARVEDGTKPRFGYLKDWKEDVEIADSDGVFRANDFFGGNIKGVLSKLDYLVSLGVSAIYFSPIFEARSNHRYDTGDYMKIDPLFGTEDEFRLLLSECDRRGIRVMLDGVFNHTGADSIYFNKFGTYKSLGAYQSEESPYYSWYTFTEFPDKYDCWWGITVVPSVKKNSKQFQNMIAGGGGVLEKWTKMGVKGWRLDVADELMPDFLKRIRKTVKENSDAVIIGEVWEDASTKVSYSIKREYLLGEELDGVTNYPFRNAVIKYLKDNDAVYFRDFVLAIAENYPKQALDASMTLIGTHDTARIINELSGAAAPHDKRERLRYRLTPEEYKKGKDKIKLAAAIQYMLPGVPVIFYGDEAGLQGFDDPINRRPMPWDNMDTEISEWYKALGRIRKENRDDMLAGIKVGAIRHAVKIIRGSLNLIVNPDKAGIYLQKPVFDLISQKETALIKGGSAVIFKN